MDSLDSLKHFQLVERGLLITGFPSLDEWAQGWRWLKQFDGLQPWIIGDMLVFGEAAYGDLIHQETEADDNDSPHFKYESLRNYKYVANRFPLSSRRYKLGWSYYQAVASLPDDQALALLQHTSELPKPNRQELRQLVAQISNGKTLPPTRPDDRQFELETENHRLQQRVSELEQTVIMLEPGEPIAPDDLPKYATRAIADLENWLLECGDYSSVTVYQNGDVKWHK